MASLRKDPRKKSPFWYASLTLPNGTRTTRSTKTTNRSEAIEIAQKWQRAEDMLAEEYAKPDKPLQFSSPQGVLETIIALSQKAVSGDLTEVMAKNALNELLSAGGQSSIKSIPTEEFIHLWLESKKTTKANGTYLRYKKTLDDFLKSIGQKAKRPLDKITPHEIEAFRDLQVKEGKSPASANLTLKTIRAALNTAKKRGMILTNPSEAIDLLEEDRAERITFSKDQLKALLKVADEEWKGLILLGCTVGCRIGDASQMTWANIDLVTKVIRFTPQKSTKGLKKKIIETVLLPDLESHLLKLPVSGKDPKTPLFPRLSQKAVGGEHGLSLLFREVMVKAGVECEAVRDKVKGKGRRFFDLGFHSLRKSFISTIANLNVPKELRMLMVGHASEEVHDIYTKIESETIRKALKKFPRIL